MWSKVSGCLYPQIDFQQYDLSVLPDKETGKKYFYHYSVCHAQEKLLADIEIPVPDEVVLDEVNAHLEGEGRLEDAEHRAEVDGQVRSSIKSDFLFDTIVKAESIQVNEMELTEYLIRMSQRYGMGPEQFAQELQKAGQINQVIAEVTRAKALASVLARTQVVDKSGNAIDLEALRPAQPAEVQAADEAAASEESKAE